MKFDLSRQHAFSMFGGAKKGGLVSHLRKNLTMFRRHMRASRPDRETLEYKWELLYDALASDEMTDKQLKSDINQKISELYKGQSSVAKMDSDTLMSVAHDIQSVLDSADTQSLKYGLAGLSGETGELSQQRTGYAKKIERDAKRAARPKRGARVNKPGSWGEFRRVYWAENKARLKAMKFDEASREVGVAWKTEKAKRGADVVAEAVEAPIPSPGRLRSEVRHNHRADVNRAFTDKRAGANVSREERRERRGQAGSGHGDLEGGSWVDYIPPSIKRQAIQMARERLGMSMDHGPMRGMGLYRD